MKKIIYYIDAILITCNVIFVYKPFCSKTNSNFSVLHVMSYYFINLFAVRLIITLVFSIYVEAVRNLIWTNKPAKAPFRPPKGAVGSERDSGQWRIWLSNVDHNGCQHMLWDFDVKSHGHLKVKTIKAQWIKFFIN